MPQSTSDAALVAKVQAGDKAAFDQLVLKHQSKLLRVINRYTHDPSESLDILQDALIKAYRAMGEFRGDSAFYTWIYRIVINTAKNYLAMSEKRLSPKKADAEDESLLSEETSDHYLLKAFERLPKPLQSAMTLREIGGLSYLEIAEAMKVPIGTVRSRISRARALLAQLA